MSRTAKPKPPPVVRDEAGLASLRAHGVTRAITLWPEWGIAFTRLDKRVENRPMPPFRNLIGERIAFHMGKDVGGRKGPKSYWEGIQNVLLGAATGGLSHGGEDPLETIRRTGFSLVHELRVDSEQTHPNPNLDPSAACTSAVRHALESGRDDIGLVYKLTPKGGETTVIRVPQDIVTSASTFTAIIGGFHPPTPDPKIPWQVGTQRGEEPSYAWLLEGLEVLAKPITCPGMQGVWTL